MRIQVILLAKWQFKDYNQYVVTSCKKIVNLKSGKIIKCTKSGGSIGYYINQKFIKKSDINPMLEKIKISKLPF